MSKQFHQIHWDEAIEDDCRQLVRLAVREDLSRGIDLTTVALIPPEASANASVVARCDGVIAGMRTIELVLRELDIRADCKLLADDGAHVSRATRLAELSMVARDLLTSERLLLNILGRLSGVATLTRQYVNCVAGTGAKIYDTRKTTPGLRRLEKYAVRCGGGMNHRTGLFDAVLIKDNHLAIAGAEGVAASPADAVESARKFLADFAGNQPAAADTIVEIEVDTLDQLQTVLPTNPDIVLLDNMRPAELREAVALRNRQNPNVELEASGGITLENVHEIAETGVQRISIGALTHSAPNFDVALDW